MSLVQINDYGIGNVNLTSLMDTLDRQRRGYQALSLTHYDDTLEPKIAAGSIIEVGGALFKTEADESITGWAGIGNSNDVYIRLAPAGQIATAFFGLVTPTWSTSKQGWYYNNDRYVGGLYKDGSGNYYNKYLMERQVGFVSGLGFEKHLLTDIFTKEKIIEIGDWDLETISLIDVTDLLTAAGINSKKVRSISVIIRSDDDAWYWHVPGPIGLIEQTVIPFRGIAVYRASVNYVFVVLQIRDNTLDYHYELLKTVVGTVDYTNINATGYNRGWVYIKYQA